MASSLIAQSRCRNTFLLANKYVRRSAASFANPRPLKLNATLTNRPLLTESQRHLSMFKGFDEKRNEILAQFPPGNPNEKPKLEHLLFIKEKLTVYLPKIFKEMHPYYLYTPDMIFENNFFEQPKTSVGVLAYAMALSAIRIKANLKYSFLQVQLIKVTHDLTDGSVTVRWQIAAISGMKTFLKPWKIKVWKIKDSLKSEVEYIDGISTFYVRGDGRIIKHRVDRVITDKNTEKIKDKELNKLANLAGVNTAI